MTEQKRKYPVTEWEAFPTYGIRDTCQIGEIELTEGEYRDLQEATQRYLGWQERLSAYRPKGDDHGTTTNRNSAKD